MGRHVPVCEELVAGGGVVDEDIVEVMKQTRRRLEVLQPTQDDRKTHSSPTTCHKVRTPIPPPLCVHPSCLTLRLSVTGR